MASTVWKGQLNFGFVSMPVKFTSGAVKESISFNQLHKGDNSRLKQIMHCAAENKPVDRSEIVKGYEYEKDKYVTLTTEEIEAIAPETAESMDVLEFVNAADVDPVFFESAYHLAPEVGGERAYALLYQTMRKTRMVAVTKIAMHQREHVAILRPGARGIILQTLFYHDEVRAIQEFRTDCDLVKGTEVAMASQLAREMAADWQPEKYSDTYRAKLKQLVEAKVSGKPLESAAKNGRKSPSNVVDISEALKLSMKQARRGASALRAKAKS